MKYNNFDEFESRWNERISDLFPGLTGKSLRYYSSAEAVKNGEPMKSKDAKEKLNNGEMLWVYSPIGGLTMPFMKNKDGKVIDAKDLLIYESTAIFALESKIAATKLPEKPPKASGWSRFFEFLRL